MNFKAVEIELGGTKVPLCFNNRAMFAMQAKLGKDMLDKISGTDEEAYQAAVDALLILNAEAVAVKRRLGYAAEPELDADVSELMTPADWVKAKAGIFAAVALGYDREVPDSEDVDLVLLEYQKKTGPGRS